MGQNFLGVLIRLGPEHAVLRPGRRSPSPAGWRFSVFSPNPFSSRTRWLSQACAELVERVDFQFVVQDGRPLRAQARHPQQIASTLAGISARSSWSIGSEPVSKSVAIFSARSLPMPPSRPVSLRSASAAISANDSGNFVRARYFPWCRDRDEESEVALEHNGRTVDCRHDCCGKRNARVVSQCQDGREASNRRGNGPMFRDPGRYTEKAFEHPGNAQGGRTDDAIECEAGEIKVRLQPGKDDAKSPRMRCRPRRMHARRATTVV